MNCEKTKETNCCQEQVTCKNDYSYIIIVVLYVLLAIILSACFTRY